MLSRPQETILARITNNVFSTLSPEKGIVSLEKSPLSEEPFIRRALYQKSPFITRQGHFITREEEFITRKGTISLENGREIH